MGFFSLRDEDRGGYRIGERKFNLVKILEALDISSEANSVVVTSSVDGKTERIEVITLNAIFPETYCVNNLKGLLLRISFCI